MNKYYNNNGELNGNYKYTLAGTAENLIGIGIYVKYKNTGLDEVKVKNVNSNYIKFETPDRIITLASNQTNGNLSFLKENYDQFINLSLLYNFDSNMDIFMINAPYFIKRKVLNKLCLKSYDIDSFILCDSGGFQLVMGRADFINPI